MYLQNEALPVNLLVDHDPTKDKHLIGTDQHRLQRGDFDLKIFFIPGFSGSSFARHIGFRLRRVGLAARIFFGGAVLVAFH